MSRIHLLHKTVEDAANEALEHIHKERSGEQYGLYTSIVPLNIAMGKYFRFANVNLLAGLSGSGKSYLLNSINNDFLDYGVGGINEQAPFIPIIFNFCFEMSAANEVLRSIANDMGVSYAYLLSSEYDKISKTYNRLSDEELLRVEEYLKYYKRKSMLFFEVPSNLQVIYNTVEHYVEEYTKVTRSDNKPFKFIVNIDHTLLIETLDESSAVDLMANVGKIAIRIRKTFGALVNLVGQLNNNIEDIRRITNNLLHYPIKSDIYAQGQLYNACDSVFVVHQPAQLKITKYGSTEKDTTNLMHLLKLKSRHGSTGNIWLKNALDIGKIVEMPKSIETAETEDTNLKHI